MLRRVPYHRVADLDEVEQLARASTRAVVIIFDVDNTLAAHGTPPDELADRVERTVDRFEAVPAVDRVIVLTNGPRRSERMIPRANKPWTSRRRIGLDGSEDAVWVVGDQVLTDGLLAWRLGAEFVCLAISRTDDPPVQAWMRAAGRLAGGVLLEQSDPR